MRGIMNFDDYNYKSYNDYVLIKEPNITAGKKKSVKVDQMLDQILLKPNVELKEDLLMQS